MKNYSTEKPIPNVAVIGGGLAGLSSATRLSQSGYQVTLYEKSNTLGGRAKTANISGFHFNYGPHALYRGGSAYQTLELLGVELNGAQPSLTKNYLSFENQLYVLPGNLWQLATSQFFSWQEKYHLVRWLANSQQIDANHLNHLSASEWVSQQFHHRRLKLWLTALIRLATYVNDLHTLSAEIACRQLQLSLRQGVLYLDEGWQKLVTELTKNFKHHKGEIKCKTAVSSIQPVDGLWQVESSSQKVARYNAILLALPYQECKKLLIPFKPDLPTGQSVHGVSWELGLSHLPKPKRLFALGLDNPYYFSVHSASADLAPKSQHTVHVAKYLTGDEQGSAMEIKQELEEWLDTIQPGWKSALITERFLPKMKIISHLAAIPTAVFLHKLPGLAVAGDWCSDKYLLCDASIESANEAVSKLESYLATLTNYAYAS